MTTIAMILFDDVTQLDLTGPLEVLSRMPDTTIHLVSKTLAPVKSGSGLVIVPDTTFETCPHNLTILFIPGGPGIAGVMRDGAFLDRSEEHTSELQSQSNLVC